MVIRTVAVVLSVLAAAPFRAMGAQPAQPAPAPQTATDLAGKADKKDAQDKPPKAKKAKKPKSDVPAPDEPVDPETTEGGKGFRASWKQHPSIRYGSVFRLDVGAKFQEDARAAYPNAAGLKDTITGKPKTWELHRNRVGIQGHLFKKIEYEVERELTEKELVEKDIRTGGTDFVAGPQQKSPWKKNAW